MHESASLIENAQAQRTGKLPRYLFRRDGYFYFKRKIPADVRPAFGGKSKQTWKSLGTTLLEKAKVLLAVEVSEFDFLVAKLRRTHANRAAGVPLIEAVEVSNGASVWVVAGGEMGRTIKPSASLGAKACKSPRGQSEECEQTRAFSAWISWK